MNENIDEKDIIKNSLENKQFGYKTEELERFNFPRVELKDGTVIINGKLIEGLSSVDGYYISPDGRSIAVYKKPKYKDRKEEEENELMNKGGYRSGIFPDRALYVLGYEGEDRNEFKIKSTEEDCTLDQDISKESGHLIGSKDYLNNEKEKQHIPTIDGVSYENFRDCYFIDGANNKNIFQIRDVARKTFFVNKENLAESVTFEDNEEKGTYKVNGINWDSLSHKDIYYGGYRVVVDFENKKTMFNYNTKDKIGFIVNNRDWEFKCENYSRSGIQNGLAYVATAETLIIDDKKWNDNPIITKVAEKGGNEGKYSDIRNVTLGGKDGRIAVANNCHENGKWVNEIIEGDIHGPSKRWKNKMTIEKMIAGKDIVAVVGKDTENNSALFINDVLVKLDDDVSEFLDLKIKKNKVNVTYKTAMGEVVSILCNLEENSEEAEKLRVEKEEQEKSLHELRNRIFQEGLNPKDFLEKFNKLVLEGNKSKEKDELLRNLNLRMNELKIKSDNEITEKNEKITNLVEELKNKKFEITSALREVKKMLDSASGAAFGGFKISSEMMKSIKEEIKNTLEKNQG